MTQNYPRYEVKAGKFNFDQETKKVKVSKDKGKLAFYTNSQGQNHVSWINLETNLQEIDLILFPFDAHFSRVNNQNNTYLLKFDSNEDKYFFYLQEKLDPEVFVKSVNERIAFSPEEHMEIQQPVEKLETPQKVHKIQKIQEEPVMQEPQHKYKGINADFITRLTNNLMAASKKGQGEITALSKILTHDTISKCLSQLTEEQKLSMVQFLPEEQRQAKHIASNVRSPQFQQAVDVLSDALNSQNVIPLFIQLGLDQKHLKKHYGVHAFLIALQQWAEKQQSAEKMEVEEKPEKN